VPTFSSSSLSRRDSFAHFRMATGHLHHRRQIKAITMQQHQSFSHPGLSFPHNAMPLAKIIMTQRTKARKIKAPCSSIVNSDAVWFISYLFRHTQLRIVYARIITVGKIIPSNLHLEHALHLWPILLLQQFPHSHGRGASATKMHIFLHPSTPAQQQYRAQNSY